MWKVTAVMCKVQIDSKIRFIILRNVIEENVYLESTVNLFRIEEEGAKINEVIEKENYCMITKILIWDINEVFRIGDVYVIQNCRDLVFQINVDVNRTYLVLRVEDNSAILAVLKVIRFFIEQKVNLHVWEIILINNIILIKVANLQVRVRILSINFYLASGILMNIKVDLQSYGGITEVSRKILIVLLVLKRKSIEWNVYFYI